MLDGYSPFPSETKYTRLVISTLDTKNIATSTLVTSMVVISAMVTMSMVTKDYGNQHDECIQYYDGKYQGSTMT